MALPQQPAPLNTTFSSIHSKHPYPSRGQRKTSSQIYLSRGVAGTEDDIHLPASSLESLQVTSNLESASIRRLTLKPTLTPVNQKVPQKKNSTVQKPQRQVMSSLGNQETTANLHAIGPNSRLIHHILPHSATGTHRSRTTFRITKSEHHKNKVACGGIAKRRVTFHRYIMSNFGNNHDRSAPLSFPQARSEAASFSSKSGPPHGSMPSLDLVSPSAFTFSGPSLRSTCSLAKSVWWLSNFTESQGAIEMPRRARSDSYSILDYACGFDEGISEPGNGINNTRTVPDVLMGVDTATDKGTSCNTPPDLVPLTTTFVSLLSPFIDFAA